MQHGVLVSTVCYIVALIAVLVVVGIIRRDRRPRCIECRHWQTDQKGHWDAHECALLGRDFCCSGQWRRNGQGMMDLVAPDFPSGCTGGGSFESRPNFGCVLWEER